MNIELAMAALEDAKVHSENFDMATWWSGPGVTKDAADVAPPCGTTACYAGFASLRAAPVGSKIQDRDVILPDGTREHVETYAMEVLGITRSQAWSLFYLNTIEQVETALTYLAEHPDATERELDMAAYGEDSGDEDSGDEDSG